MEISTHDGVFKCGFAASYFHNLMGHVGRDFLRSVKVAHWGSLWTGIVKVFWPNMHAEENWVVCSLSI